jgi:nickel-type superoxide dismutase maturation protease
VRYARGLLGLLVISLLARGVLVAWRRIDVVEVRGRSMAPTLQPGDRLLAVRLDRAARAGDVVLAPDPRDPARELVKRVASIDAAGIRLRGDNPAFSTDARVFGAISPAAVRWRIAARYWPMRLAGRIPSAPMVSLPEEGGEPACAVPESLIAG